MTFELMRSQFRGIVYSSHSLQLYKDIAKSEWQPMIFFETELRLKGLQLLSKEIAY